MDENSRLIAVPFVSGKKGPNVEVSVSIADCAGDPNVPFAFIGTDAAFERQSTAISWNPYIAGAKFVLHQVQGNDSIQLLADDIAQKIKDERLNLKGRDSPAISPTN